jgi:hypothetical protein
VKSVAKVGGGNVIDIELHETEHAVVPRKHNVGAPTGGAVAVNIVNAIGLWGTGDSADGAAAASRRGAWKITDTDDRAFICAIVG